MSIAPSITAMHFFFPHLRRPGTVVVVLIRIHTSERKPQRELDHSRISAHRSDSPKGRGRRIVGQVRKCKIGMVESIEEVRPELYARAFLRPRHLLALA